MKTIKNIILATIAAVVLLTSCDFGDINKSPNSPSTAFTTYLFTYSTQYVPYFVLGSSTNGYDPWQQEWPGYFSESKNNQYGPLGCTISFSPATYYLYPLKNLNMIIEMNEDPEQADETNVTVLGSTANQIAVAKTLSAYFYMSITDIQGPIVLSEAFQGSSDDNWTPVYDTQESVYKQLDEMLSAAYKQFDESGSLNASADVLYGGDIAKWKKFNASLRMLLAIKLSDVDPSTGKTRFAAAYADGGMTSPADDFSFTYDDLTWNRLYYWVSPDYSGAGFTAVPNMYIVEAMKELKDNRMFKYFDIEGYRGTRDEATFPRDQYTSFYGVPFGLRSNNEVAAWVDCCCSINSDLLGMTATIPVIPAARVLLTEAEAAQRGWISADPKTLYEAGIKASFEQWGASGADAYVKSAGVAYDGTIEQIATQRWIASYMSDGVEAWSDWRRLDVPVLRVGPGAVDGGITHYPYRLAFSTDYDVKYNSENYQAALKDLNGGTDDVNSRVWWDVAPNTEGVLTDEECTPSISIPEDWQKVGEGVYSSEWWEEDLAVELWEDANRPGTYKVKGIQPEGLEAYDMSFILNTDNTIKVEETVTSYIHDSYGQVYCADSGYKQGSAVTSYYDGSYHFILRWYVSAGYFGDYEDVLTMN